MFLTKNGIFKNEKNGKIHRDSKKVNKLICNEKGWVTLLILDNFVFLLISWKLFSMIIVPNKCIWRIKYGWFFSEFLYIVKYWKSERINFWFWFCFKNITCHTYSTVNKTIWL